jgi:hypothetical protein
MIQLIQKPDLFPHTDKFFLDLLRILAEFVRLHREQLPCFHIHALEHFCVRAFTDQVATLPLYEGLRSVGADF